MRYRDLVEKYFRAEEEGDVATVVALCSPTITIRNAAQPPQHGKDGAESYVASFNARTDRRQFTVRALAEEGDVIFAWWNAVITFKAGVAFGSIVTKRPFALPLQGVCRFKLDDNAQLVELDVFHETTTALRLAQEASQ